MRHSLQKAGSFDVIAEAPDGEKAVELALKLKPDVCLLDISMPGGGGIKAAAAISDQLPDTAIVMLTAFAGDEELFDSLRAGAAGYLLKETDPNRLPFALRGILEGEAAVPPAPRGPAHRRVPLTGSAPPKYPVHRQARPRADRPPMGGPGADGRGLHDERDR